MDNKENYDKILDRYLNNVGYTKEDNSEIKPKIPSVSMFTEPNESLLKDKVEDFCVDLGSDFFWV